MLYIQDRSFERQVDLLSGLARGAEYDIVLWLYPESKLKKILNLDLITRDRESLESVTTYSGDVSVKRSGRIACDDFFWRELIAHSKVVVKNVDSLCLYKKNEQAWRYCSIAHEGMVLVRDDSLYDTILGKSYSVSKSAPDWW